MEPSCRSLYLDVKIIPSSLQSELSLGFGLTMRLKNEQLNVKVIKIIQWTLYHVRFLVTV